MCGILGVIKNSGQIEEGGFRELTDALSHRGPDASGVWMNKNANIALGHRRLSIIDLQGGGQPMMSFDKDLAITYNGEIYNYVDLRRELVLRGRRFHSDSDTEVVLAAYREWGEGCLSRFRGMFAFGIYDIKKGELFLARDPVGVKPLVYYRDKKLFCFASEISALARIKNLDLQINYKAIDLYLWLQYIPAPKSIYTQIEKLEPAHYMRVDSSGRIIGKKKYWRPAFKPADKKNRAWLEELEEVLRDSVKAHTVSDVPVGAFLSGGIDSTLIVKYLSEIKQDFETFSIGFNEKKYNELDFSCLAAEKYGSRHFTKVVTSDFFSVLHKLVKHYGEPFGDSSAIPTYYVSKLAAGRVKVVLSGDGGDELFGGYNSYIAWQNKAKGGNRSLLYKLARNILSFIHPNKYIKNKPSLACWLSIVGYYNYNNRKYLFKKEYAEYLNKSYDFFSKDNFKQNSLVHKAQLFDLMNYLPFDILRKVDIASMMHGLEVRVPFLDKKVIDFALSMPEELNATDEGWQGKRMLKKIISRDLPDNFAKRKKQGFAVPLDAWFAPAGELYSEPFRRLMNSDSRIFKEIFNLDAVYNFISGEDYSKIYFLLFLEEWLKQFENRKNLIEI